MDRMIASSFSYFPQGHPEQSLCLPRDEGTENPQGGDTHIPYIVSWIHVPDFDRMSVPPGTGDHVVIPQASSASGGGAQPWHMEVSKLRISVLSPLSLDLSYFRVSDALTHCGPELLMWGMLLGLLGPVSVKEE